MAENAVGMLTWDVSSATDRGRVRRRNEDTILVRPERRLYAVADGMGGHAAGNIASALAIGTLESAFPRAPSSRIGAVTLSKRMRDAFANANDVIERRSATRKAEAGMGTTLTALATLTTQPACVIAHIGDSRAYRFRPGDGLTQLTKDHTWVQQQVDAGALGEMEARAHPWSSILTRVLGMEQPGAADIVVADAIPGDTFLLCSDGLTGMVCDADIASILGTAPDLPDICRRLIDAANASGGRDNISVVVLRARA
jgi:protein phosphatase